MTHYFSSKQESPINEKKIRIRVKNIAFDVYTASGVFSKDRLDTGSQELIENCIIEGKREALDLGCGIGVVGIALKKLYPELSVTMVDINERAVTLAKKNIKLNHVEIDIKISDLFSRVDKQFDTILSNPPQSAGKELCFRIIEESKNHLNADGTLQMVARHNKGGASLEKKMGEVFGNVKQISKGSGYRVYLSVMKTNK